MKQIDKYYQYIFILMFMGSLTPEKGLIFEISFELLWKSLVNALFGIAVVVIVLRCLAQLIAEKIKPNQG